MDDLFEKTEDYVITVKFYDCEQTFTIEELYQAFKTRLSKEFGDMEEGE